MFKILLKSFYAGATLLAISFPSVSTDLVRTEKDNSQQNQPSSCHLPHFPPEILIHIAECARIKDCISLASTCTELEFLNSDPNLWEQYAKRFPGYRALDGEQKPDGKQVIKDLMTPDLHEFKCPSGWSDVTVLGSNANGTQLIGTAKINSIKKAFSWTSEKNFELLECLDEQDTSFASSISHDGSIIIGTSGVKPVFWSGQDRRLHPLKVSNQDLTVLPFKVSGNGCVIAGIHANRTPQDEQQYPAIWTSIDESPRIFDESVKACIITGINFDGTVIIGSDFQLYKAFIMKKGTVSFLTSSIDGFADLPMFCNHDGSKIIGVVYNKHSSSDRRACIWENEQPKILNFFKDEDASSSLGMSKNGNVIVGFSKRNCVKQIVIKIGEKDAFFLADLFPKTVLNKSLKTTNQNENVFLSADGTMIIGQHNSPSEVNNIWMVYLPSLSAFEQEGIYLPAYNELGKENID